MVVRLWETCKKPIFRFGFSIYYNKLLQGGTWRAALSNEVEPREGARVLQVHIQKSDLSADFLAKYPGRSLQSVNPLDPAPVDGEEPQCLAFQHGRIGCDGASFDEVICCLALHPLRPPGKLALLKEMRRVLRSHGRLYLADLDMASSKGQTLTLSGTGDLYGPDTAQSHADGTWKSQIELSGFCHVRQVYSEANVSGRISIIRARR